MFKYSLEEIERDMKYGDYTQVIAKLLSNHNQMFYDKINGIQSQLDVCIKKLQQIEAKMDRI